MGRGRGKGKKSLNGSDETGSGPDEIIPIQKRRGRPLKPLKDESDQEDQENQETDADSAPPLKDERDGGSNVRVNLVISTKEAEKNAKKKRKKLGGNGLKAEEREKEEGREKEEEREAGGERNGFRQSGNRRKSKPRRAAEAGIRCDW